jgi:hypothetical protein
MHAFHPVGWSFFPLDEELKLLPGDLTPRLAEQLVRLGSWISSFEKAVKLLEDFTGGVVVSSASSWRRTEAAGAAYVQLQERGVQQLEAEQPAEPEGPAKLFVSVDGAMVPLVGGEWAEVKTLALGEVEPPTQQQGEAVIRTGRISYFSRLTDATTFERLALVETHRRGMVTAAACAVTDGSAWCRGFVDYHRPDAVHILDFPHAAKHLGQIGQIVFGEGSPQTQQWLSQQLHSLKRDGPVPLLEEVHRLVGVHVDEPLLSEHLAYLEKREAHMQYPTFQSAGWPIGDGVVESGQKLLVEARLKGSGMHWARLHVDPMLALRNIVCNDRWEEAWPQIAGELRCQPFQRRARRCEMRQASRGEEMNGTNPTAETDEIKSPAPPLPEATPEPTPSVGSIAEPSAEQPRKPCRPAPDHPWRKPFLLTTKRQNRAARRNQKT